MEYRNIVAILTLIFYTPFLLLSALLIHRHGFRQSWTTWFVLATFALSRLAWASLQLATLRVAAATLAADALSPLLFCALGLVARLRGVLARVVGVPVDDVKPPPRLLGLLDLVVTAAFICASVGYRGLSSEDVREGMRESPEVIQAAAYLYIVALAGIVGGAGVVGVMGVLYRREMPEGEGRALWVLLGSLPLLVVRTVYFAVDVLGNVRSFSAIYGNVTLFLCMGLVVEAVVASSYLGVGFTLRVVSKEELEEQKKETREGDEESGNVALWDRTRTRLGSS
ncbi:uncharacterized protein LTHEOB_4791 [Neofusicoccum parvum]|uniref:Uncharacterized protein LTHEOB_4791 n=1 Tax=Neofusicoccum parvum TaxID=310453 RepID=A0ACB5RZ07_9PEZI|nr:uncharacterized protein LTHEOB_4791 [Neofusicoccum parvum]